MGSKVFVTGDWRDPHGSGISHTYGDSMGRSTTGMLTGTVSVGTGKASLNATEIAFLNMARKAAGMKSVADGIAKPEKKLDDNDLVAMLLSAS